MSEVTFARRRNIWIALTVVAFLSPTFWLYAIFALFVLAWASSKDENPLALYVFVTFAVPNAKFYIQFPFMEQLFDITQLRILSLVVLLPALMRMHRDKMGWGSLKLTAIDLALLSFLALQVVLQYPYESGTAAMRHSFLLFIDYFLVVYAFSRITRAAVLKEVIFCFWIACAVMAPIAIFETAKGWLLYTGLNVIWGDPNVFSFLFRGGSLRAQAATGHSLVLGYILAVGLGFFLYIEPAAQRARYRWPVAFLFAAGLFVSGSRGAWLTGFLLIILFVAFRPNAGKRLAGAALMGGVLIAGMYFTPLKEAVLDKLPIIGTSDQDTVEYRQQLFDVSIQLIKVNPLFGDPFVADKMESLRQGQGIVDIVNGYLFTALFNGLVGLGLLLVVLLGALVRAGLALRRDRAIGGEMATLGAALISTFLASLFFVATAGFTTTVYLLAGLLISYSSLGRVEVQSITSRPRVKNFSHLRATS